MAPAEAIRSGVKTPICVFPKQELSKFPCPSDQYETFLLRGESWISFAYTGNTSMK